MNNIVMSNNFIPLEEFQSMDKINLKRTNLIVKSGRRNMKWSVLCVVSCINKEDR